jgi:UDP-N-acetyl-D-mannosaminuronate dehydrogenase
MRHLVIGLGEVGSAIQSILQCHGLDFDKQSTADGGPYDVVHICFPFNKTFTESVKNYVALYKATLVIVHSSVPVGTCDAEGWVHSPVRGVHPNLKQGILTFVKYFGGTNAVTASRIFSSLDIPTQVTPKAATTEALKLWDTTQYGLMIMIQKEIYDWCKRNDVDPEIVYTDANHTYDIGYEALNRPEVARPYLKHMPGPIGGHCVIPNAHLLDDSPLASLLLDYNEELQNTQG